VICRSTQPESFGMTPPTQALSAQEDANTWGPKDRSGSQQTGSQSCRPGRRRVPYARDRIQPLRVLLRPRTISSAHLFIFESLSSGSERTGTTGVG